MILEKWFFKLLFFLWSTTFLEPEKKIWVCRTTFLEPDFSNQISQTDFSNQISKNCKNQGRRIKGRMSKEIMNSEGITRSSNVITLNTQKTTSFVRCVVFCLKERDWNKCNHVIGCAKLLNSTMCYTSDLRLFDLICPAKMTTKMTIQKLKMW